MSYTVTKLITNAYYLSGKTARQLEDVTGDELNDGLDMLNDFLGIKTANRRLIPYDQLTTIAEVPGQEVYFIPNLVDVISCTFNIGPVRFPMTRMGEVDYFSSARVDNIESLSFSYNFRRVQGGGEIRVYFLPASNYPLNILGRYGLTQITDLDLDLSTIMDRFYITYMRYGLAEYIANEFAITFPPENREKLSQFEVMIEDLNPIDFTMVKHSSLTATGGLTWGDVNIGKGYRPS